MIQSIMEMAEERLIRLNSRVRVTCPVSDLVIGLQCGGSDAFSGVTANPAVGYAADLLVRAGATVLFSEVTEVRDAIHLLTPRAVSEEVGRSLIDEMKWYDSYLRRGKQTEAPIRHLAIKRRFIQCGGKSVRIGSKVRHKPHFRCARAWGEGGEKGFAVCSDAGKRLCVRNPSAGGRHESAGLYDRQRNTVWIGCCAGAESIYTPFINRALGGFNRY